MHIKTETKTKQIVRKTTSQSFFEDINREKSPFNITPVLTKSIKNGYLGSWYIKSMLYKRFLN